MAYTSADLGEYVESLYNANNFEKAFSVFEKQAVKLGFEEVLYSYILRAILDTNFSYEPVFKTSLDYSPSYLEYYFGARYDRDDPPIKAVNAGTSVPIDW